MTKRILVIDDEELVIKSLSRLFKAEGFEAVAAASGPEALSRIKEADFDLVISDIRMPGMDGIETIKRIRASRAAAGKKRIPEILITGYADRDKYEEALELEISDYVYKPFDREYLLRIVRRTMGVSDA